MSTRYEVALTRREMLKMLGAGSAAILLAACAPKPAAAPTSAPAPAATEKPAEPTATPAAAEAPTAAPAAGQVTIEFWTAWGGGEKPWLEPMLADFEAKHTDIKVNFVFGGPGGGDYNELLLARIAAGSPPDVAHTFTPPVGFAARGSLDVIDELMAQAQYAKPEKFWPKVLKTCQFKGKTYGLPFSAGCCGIFYNTDWLAEKGLKIDRESFPKTWDDLRALSKDFVVWDGEELKTGGIVPWFELWQMPAYSASFGAQLFKSDELQYTIDDPGNVALLEYWVSWLDEQYKGNVDYLSSLGGWYAGPDSLWIDKRVPMGYGGSWTVSYEQMKYEKIFKWDVGKMTAGPNGKGMTAFWPNWFTLPVGGKHRQQGFLLCEYMCTIGMPIWYKVVNDTPAWLDFPREVITQNLIDNVGADKAKDIHNFFIDYLEEAVEMWTSPIEDFGTDQINRAVDRVLHKAQPAKDALAEAQKVSQAKLEETMKAL